MSILEVCSVNLNDEFNFRKQMKQNSMINRFYIGLSITKEYDIRTTCGTKEELPFLTPEEFDRRSSMQPVMQLRVPMNHPSK